MAVRALFDLPWRATATHPEQDVIETPEHLRQVREAMGWSPADLARALRFAENHGASRILEMEAGKRAISGPVAVAVEAFLRGFVPAGFERPG